MDDGIATPDIIHCNPRCYHRVRFDTILVDIGQGWYRPARLHLVFELTVYQLRWQLARVTYFTQLKTRREDRIIGMDRYEEERCGEFIFLDSILRSCYMQPDPRSPGYFYLNNLATGSTDLYLHCRLHS